MNRRTAISLTLLFVFLCGAFAAPKPTTDDIIYDQVKRKLANDQVVKGGGLETDVKQGVVTLKGMVENEKVRARAERLVRKIKGVKSVNNLLKVGPKTLR